MSSAQRYSVHAPGMMIVDDILYEDPEGDLVLYEDHVRETLRGPKCRGCYTKTNALNFLRDRITVLERRLEECQNKK